MNEDEVAVMLRSKTILSRLAHVEVLELLKFLAALGWKRPAADVAPPVTAPAVVAPVAAPVAPSPAPVVVAPVAAPVTPSPAPVVVAPVAAPPAAPEMTSV